MTQLNPSISIITINLDNYIEFNNTIINVRELKKKKLMLNTL